MTKVLIVDQFSGILPHTLRADPTNFEWLCEEVLKTDPSTLPKSLFLHRKPVVKEVPEDFVPEMATTVLRADANGNAEIWKYRWDSSG